MVYDCIAIIVSSKWSYINSTYRTANIIATCIQITIQDKGVYSGEDI